MNGMTTLAAADSANSLPMWVGFVLWIVIGLAYFAPTIVCLFRKAENAAQVAVVNFFLGWTFFGWVIALVMALKPKPQPPPHAMYAAWQPPPGAAPPWQQSTWPQ